MFEQPTIHHQWLDQLVGEWTYDSECQTGPGVPPMKTTGTEIVRSLGGLWTVGEASIGVDESAGRSIMTLGYSAIKQKYVGTFIASMMTHLWPYEGELDASRRRLVLDSEGPSFSGDGTIARYQDTIEIVDADHRILSSRVLLPSGEWQDFMVSRYNRVGTAP